MTAVLVLARCELRRRWRSALALALLVGFVGAVVLASAAGAHRSSTSLQRFIAYSRSSDAELDLTNPTPAQLRAFRRSPLVTDFAVLHAFALVVRGRPNLKNAATVDGRLGVAVDRARVVAGRAPDPNAINEIAIGESLAAQQHLALGDDLVADSLTPAQLEEANHGQDPGEAKGPVVRLRIVGIVRRPLDLGDLSASGGVVIETPAFNRAYEGRIANFATILRTRTRNGSADIPQLGATARKVFGPRLSSFADVSAEAHGGEDAINVLTLALWIFAGIAALAGAVAVAIVLSRDVSQSDIGQPTLAALGLTRRQRLAAFSLRVLLIAAGGVIVAAVIAILVSPMFPIGIARRAEPSPGIRIDGLVLGIGSAGIIAFVILVGLVTATRATRRSFSSASITRRSRRTIADVAARAGARPTAALGVGMALEPGAGTDAVPVRSAFLGAILGVVGLTAVLVFASSLGHLDSTPRLYGWTWDFKAPDNSFAGTCDARDFGLAAVPGVTAVAGVCYEGIEVDGRPTTGWGFTPVRGSIDPEVVSGRAPRTPHEVALGAATLRAIHKRIGDTVQARGTKHSGTYRIVGQIVLPQMRDGDVQPLADGATFTGTGFSPLSDEGLTRYLVGDYAGGTDHRAVDHRIDEIKQLSAPQQQSSFIPDQGAQGPTRPPEVARLRGIDSLPPLVAALIALLGSIAIGHALMTTAHRRRRELALLKTLGFSRRQVRITLAWQATTLSAVGLVVGIPVGVLAGNLVWHRVANGLGIAPVTVVPVIAIALSVPCVVVLVILIGLWPARAAARTWPAIALAAE